MIEKCENECRHPDVERIACGKNSFGFSEIHRCLVCNAEREYEWHVCTGYDVGDWKERKCK